MKNLDFADSGVHLMAVGIVGYFMTIDCRLDHLNTLYI